MLQLLKADNNTAQFLTVIDRPLMVRGFFLRFSGTLDATGIAVRDIGRIYMRCRGKDVVSADFDLLQAKNNLDNGAIETTLTASAANSVSVYIPRHYGDNNVELIEPADNYTVEINFGANIAAHVASGWTAKLFADVDQGVCRYQPLFIQQSDIFSAAGTFTSSFQLENLCQIYMTDVVSSVKTCTATPITQLVGQIGSRQFTGTLLEAVALSSNQQTVEANFALAAKIFQADGSPSSMFDDMFTLQTTCTAAANPQFLLCGARMNPTKEAISGANEKLALIRAQDNKVANGHNAAAGIVKTLIERSS